MTKLDSIFWLLILLVLMNAVTIVLFLVIIRAATSA